MEHDNLFIKIQCLYEAIEATEEVDISKYVPKVFNDSTQVGFYQDWSGEISDARRANYIDSLISNIASLEYYLNKWADKKALDKTKIKKAFTNSKALKIIHDLWDTSKHANSVRKGKSGLYPRIAGIRSSLQLKAEKNSSIRLTFNLQGLPKISGDGKAKVVISGDIQDKNGNKIGDIRQIALEAVEAWEEVLRDFGVKLPIM